MNSEVCGIVITYHPDADVLVNLRTVLPQLDRLVVIDNGSTEEELTMLRQACTGPKIELRENRSNLGIATALNLGVAKALELGASSILLFDQDSCVTPGFVSTMTTAFASRQQSTRLGLLVPAYRDLRSGRTIHADARGSGRELEVAITSGSLFPASVLERCGPFADELFIDVVDHEYSLRVRRAGYTIEECAEAVLLHSPGTPQVHRILGKTFISSNYSPVRRYYQERNKIWVARRYFLAFPRSCLRMFLVSLKDLIKIILVEPPSRAAKLRFFLLGIRDGLRQRMGPFRES